MSMIERIWTSRLSIKNSLSASRWSISGDLLQGNSSSLLAQPTFSPTGPSSSQLLMFLRSASGAAALPPGRYTITLDASLGTRKGTACTDLHIAAPPSGGNCSLDSHFG